MFAAIGQAALLVGALLVYKFPSLTKPKTIGLIMAFGAGAIISAVSTDLVAVSYEEAGGAPTALGIAIGGLGYFAVITWLEKRNESEAPTEPLEEGDRKSTRLNFRHT